MNAYCKQLILDEAVPGMILSNPIFDHNGEVLLPRGSTLTEAALSALRRCGLTRLRVLTEINTTAGKKEAHNYLHQRLIRLFRKSANQEASVLLFQYLAQYRLGDNV